MSTEQAATADVLQSLRRADLLGAPAFTRALRLTCASPGVGHWRRFLDWLLLGLGAALLLVGLILLVAFNWASLSPFVKLGLMAALLAGGALTAWHLELASLPGRIALTAAAVMIGPLLAIYGQTYQTGADPYQLFLAWAALAALWVGVSRFPPLLLVELVLVDVTLALYWEQVTEVELEVRVLALAMVHLAAWGAAELGAHRGLEWLTPRWFPRLLGVATLTPLGLLSASVALDGASSAGASAGAGLAAFIGLLAAVFWLFTGWRRDLFLVAAALAGAMSVGTLFLGRLLLSGSPDVGEVFILAALVIGEVAAAAWWLRGLHRRWEAGS